MTRQLEAHPLADAFPLLEGDELQALTDDIRRNGLRSPVITYEGRILDGRNRYLACITAGVEPRLEAYQGDDATGFVVSMNLARRHLTVSQRAGIAVLFKDYFRSGAKSNPRKRTPGGPVVPATLQGAKGEWAARAAECLGISPRTVYKAAEIAMEDEGIPKKLVAGTTTLEAAGREQQDRARAVEAGDLVQRQGLRLVVETMEEIHIQTSWISRELSEGKLRVAPSMAARGVLACTEAAQRAKELHDALLPYVSDAGEPISLSDESSEDGTTILTEVRRRAESLSLGLAFARKRLPLSASLSAAERTARKLCRTQEDIASTLASWDSQWPDQPPGLERITPHQTGGVHTPRQLGLPADG
ncbi:MAG TPA: hypothetical protein DCP69_00290 [Candidatus Omnitrophica bacterium]|nr:hypothetical protein [Candidatus Omnitrophota bacterium]